LVIVITLTLFIATLQLPRVLRIGQQGSNVYKFDIIFVLTLLKTSLKAGSSVNNSISVLSKLFDSKIGSDLEQVDVNLRNGIDFEFAFHKLDGDILYLRDCLENSIKTGSSPVFSIQNTIDTYRDSRIEKSKILSEQIGVKVLLPLGLCYLPSFIFIGLVPIIISLISTNL
jgi:hypothetical protein